jgi:hypothetical protein
MSVFACPAARAVASSPSGCDMHWNAVGAIMIGMETGWPSAVVDNLRLLTSTRTRYMSVRRS